MDESEEKNDETQYEGEDFLGSVEDAVELIEKTGADSLAVGLGERTWVL